MGKTRYEWAGFGPTYLKLRKSETKIGVTERYYVRKEAAGLEPLVRAIPEHVTGKKEIIRAAELIHAEWIHELHKPKAVKEAEAQQEKKSKLFTEVSARILELTETRNANYCRTVKWIIEDRLDPYFSVHCKYISDWTDTKWTGYEVHRRKLQPKVRLAHDLRQLRRILNYAYAEGFIERKPKIKNPDPPSKSGRCLETWEIQALYREASADLRDQLELAFRMAFRKSDILNLTWDRIDFKRGVIIFAGTQKNKKHDEIPLNPICREMLLRRKKESDSEFVFPGKDDPNSPQTDNKKAWYAACERAGVKSKFHNTRHTCATLMARAGVPEAFTQKFCRMSAKVIREIYTHLEAEDAVRAANTVTQDWT